MLRRIWGSPRWTGRERKDGSQQDFLIFKKVTHVVDGSSMGATVQPARLDLNAVNTVEQAPCPVKPRRSKG